jgi:hypothetical protein
MTATPPWNARNDRDPSSFQFKDEDREGSIQTECIPRVELAAFFLGSLEAKRESSTLSWGRGYQGMVAPWEMDGGLAGSRMKKPTAGRPWARGASTGGEPQPPVPGVVTAVRFLVLRRELEVVEELFDELGVVTLAPAPAVL